jgi:hypothetical protein
MKNKKNELNINSEIIKRKFLTKKNSFNNKIIKKKSSKFRKNEK